MPVNGDASINADKLSGIEEESDVYEGFAPHVDRSQITILNDSPAGMCRFFILHSFSFV